MQHDGFRVGIEIYKYRRDRKCEEIALSLYDVPKEKQFITGAGVFETNMHLRTEQREGKCEQWEGSRLKVIFLANMLISSRVGFRPLQTIEEGKLEWVAERHLCAMLQTVRSIQMHPLPFPGKKYGFVSGLSTLISQMVRSGNGSSVNGSSCCESKADQVRRAHQDGLCWLGLHAYRNTFGIPMVFHAFCS